MAGDGSVADRASRVDCEFACSTVYGRGAAGSARVGRKMSQMESNRAVGGDVSAAPSIVLLQDAIVFAPEPLGRRDVLLAGGKIAAIAERLSPPPGDWPVEIVPLHGARLVPGLIDGHVHLAGGGGESGPETKVAPLR